MAPVVRELQIFPAEVQSLVCVTAQHRDMLDQVLDLFEIRPDVDLDLMEHDQSLAWLTARAVTGLSEVIEKFGPHVVLVQGDTTSAMAAGLAAFYKRVPVGHVEAGLRTASRYRPFPEEMNRRLLGALATFHFAPTDGAADALRREGVAVDSIFVTGNPVVDALQWILAQQPSPEAAQLLARLGAGGSRILLVTAHRRESFGQSLRQICYALSTLVRRNSDIIVVYPVHPNPNVSGVVRDLLGQTARIVLVDPLPYSTLVHVLHRSYMVLTDSGGLQEEGPVLGKPVLVLREETERPEGIEAGVAKLVGTDIDAIVQAAERLLTDGDAYRAMALAVSPYGDGRAATRIVGILRERFRGVGGQGDRVAGSDAD